jgi:1-hydroxycarotenoid 3,4-desaturase
VLGLIWHAEASGVWAVKGGMHALARAIARLAEDRGAVFRYGAHVDRIEVQGGRVAAAHLADGTRIPAGEIVFNGDPRALYTGALGSAVRGAVPRPAVEPRSLSACVWSFAAEPSGPALSHHNVFFAGNPRAEFGPIAAGRLPEDPTLYVCAQDRGGDLVPEGPERFEIIMNAPAGLPETEEERERCRTLTFETLAGFGLHFDPTPPVSALTTPAGFDSLFPASQGSLYGRSPHGLMAPFQRPKAETRVPGLYLAGGGAHPGAGVPMATLSGKHAAAAILTGRTSTSTFRRNGYAWWYVDGISDDGAQAVSVIAFIGSVFSPWYAWSGRRDPENHVCINVATYGRGGRFTMTDRGRAALRQTPESFTVGPSSLRGKAASWSSTSTRSPRFRWSHGCGGGSR